jgi:hypothetical protein
MGKLPKDQPDDEAATSWDQYLPEPETAYLGLNLLLNSRGSLWGALLCLIVNSKARRERKRKRDIDHGSHRLHERHRGRSFPSFLS